MNKVNLVGEAYGLRDPEVRYTDGGPQSFL